MSAALQLQPQPSFRNNKNHKMRSSTTLDYYGGTVLTADAVAETSSSTRSSSSSPTTRRRRRNHNNQTEETALLLHHEDLERLLQMDYFLSEGGMELPIMPAQVGISKVTQLPSPPPVVDTTPQTKKKTTTSEKKMVQFSHHQHQLLTTTASTTKAAKAAAKTSTTASTTKSETVTTTKKKMTVARRRVVTTMMVTPKSISKATTNRAALLTREEELLYTKQIRALRAVERIRDDAASTSLLPQQDPDDHHYDDWTETQWATACGLASCKELRRIIRQGQDARSQLVHANMGLVTSIAQRHYASLKQALDGGQPGGSIGTIFTLQDCIQEGQMGLMKAAERFDPAKGVRFATYATWWIRQRIVRSISDSGRTIRLPAHVHTMLIKIRKAKKQMQQEIGREPSVPELAHYMELPVAKLQQYTLSSRSVVSLENPIQQNNPKMNDSQDKRTLGDTIASDAPTPLEHAQRQSLLSDLEQVLQDALTTTERSVLLARYGLDDGHGKSLEETARQLHVSRDRVRLIEARALNKLRSPQKNYRLKTYLGGTSTTTRAGMETGAASAGSSPSGRQRSSSIAAVDSPLMMTTTREEEWISKTMNRRTTTTATSPQAAVGMTNPFASPFDYALMASPSSSSGSSRCHSSRDGARDQDDDENRAGPAPDRLWFF